MILNGPNKFTEIIGQDIAVRTITNAIINNRISNAFILLLVCVLTSSLHLGCTQCQYSVRDIHFALKSSIYGKRIECNSVRIF